jgi:hypothetical protein
MNIHALPPTRQQIAALEHYAFMNGTGWKLDLIRDWENGTADPVLAGIRTQFGKDWLMRYRAAHFIERNPEDKVWA